MTAYGAELHANQGVSENARSTCRTQARCDCGKATAQESAERPSINGQRNGMQQHDGQNIGAGSVKR